MRHGCPHAARAAAARYGVALTEDDFRSMVAAIMATVAGECAPAILLARTALRREIWLTRIPSGPAVRVVYIPVFARILTVLPPVYPLPQGGAHGHA